MHTDEVSVVRDGPYLRIQEELADIYSQQKIYQVVLDNRGDFPIDLLSIRPRIPPGVKVEDNKDPLELSLQERYERICRKLTLILQDEQNAAYEGIRREREQALLDLVEQFIGRLESSLDIPRMWFKLIFREKFRKKVIEIYRERYESLVVPITDSGTAKTLFSSLLEDGVFPESRQVIVSSMIEQLVEIEQVTKGSGSRVAKATIKAGRAHIERFVFTFPVPKLSPVVSTVFFEAQIQKRDGSAEGEENPVESLTVSTPISISPHPAVMSLVAVVFAVVGVTVRLLSIGPLDWLDWSLQSAVGALLALGIGNALDRFPGSDNLVGPRLGWRSEMLVGILCGLFTDRALAALRAFFGL